MKMTRELAHAAGTDAGNRSMRAAGRTKWSKADLRAASREQTRLMAYVGATCRCGHHHQDVGGSMEYGRYGRCVIKCGCAGYYAA